MKKFLSLVLALVMTMSLVTVSAGAKDFTDNSKINYKEAVDVMSAVKVIDGYAEGDFRPTATLTRGAAAKIICNLILGPTTAGALVADAAPYKDVPTNHTFAGYIAYCQKAGIISGYADGSFKPANSLTGYAFMKMLLGALGYDAAKEGYTGANWSINVAKQALNIGLADDLIGDFNGVKAVTREEACLYAFNMIQADVVEYEKNSTITVGNVTVTDNSAAKSKRWGSSAINDGNIDGKKGGDGYVQFAEEYFNKLKKTSDTDAFARPATKWTNKGDKIGTYADKADVTYTKNVELGDIYKDLGMTQKDSAAKVFYNGVPAKNVSVSKSNTLKVANDNANKGLVANGTNVEVFYNSDDNAVTICVIDTYAGVINSKETKVADPYVVVEAKSSIIDPSKASVSITTGTRNRFECDTTAFEEDDVVLFTYSQKDNEIESVVKAESVTGTLTQYTLGKKLTLADKEYKYNENSVAFEMGETSMSTKSDYIAYLDQNGLVIYVDEVKFDASKYAFVMYAQSTNSKFGKDQAQLVMSDGTVKTVDTDDGYTNLVGQIVYYRADSNGEYVLRRAANQAYNGSLSTIDIAGSTGATEADRIAAFAGTGPVLGGSADFAMTNTNAKITVKSGSDGTVYANSETVFVVASTDANGKVTYDTYTGIKNAPTIIGKYTDNSVTPAKTYNHAVEAAYVMSGNLVTFMFIDATGAYTTNGKKDITFLAGQSVSKATYDVDGNVWYSYNAVVDGEITTVKVKGGTNVTNGSDGGYTKTNVVGTNFKYNNKNLVTGVTLPSNSGTLNSYTVYTGDDGVYKLSGAYTIGLGASKTRYTVASDAKMFVIDTDGVITKVADVKDITTDTSAEYIALFDNADGDIDYLFVQQVDNGKTENGSGNVTPGTVTKLDYNATAGEVKVTADKAGKYTVTVEVLSNGTYVKAASYTAIVTAPNTESAAIPVGKLTAGNARIVCGDVVVLA